MECLDRDAAFLELLNRPRVAAGIVISASEDCTCASLQKTVRRADFWRLSVIADLQVGRSTTSREPRFRI